MTGMILTVEMALATESSTLGKSLAKTIRIMLKPLVKLLMHKGITYIGLLDVLKETYVEVAASERAFHLANKRQTDSRISLLTGVHRAEVKRIRESLSSPKTAQEIKASLSAQMMAKWLSHPDFTDDNGNPIALHRQHDSESSFESLVFEVSKDKHPRSILDDWLNQQLVEINEDNRVVLKQAGYTASQDMEEKLFFGGKNISEHLETVGHNLTSHEFPRFDRAVYYKNLSPQSVKELEEFSREELLKVLKSINQKAAICQDKDRQDELNHEQIHIGAYFSKRHQEHDQ